MKRVWFFILLSALSLSSVYGVDYHAAIEVLYWAPAQTPINVGRRTTLQAEDPGSRQDLLLKPDYDWGVQAQLGVMWCARGLDLTYTYFCSDNHQDYGLDGFPTMRIPGGEATSGGSDNLEFISADVKMRYQKVDLRYSQYLSFCPSLYLYANARWAEVAFDNLDAGKTDISGPFTDFYDQASCFSGGGLGFGLGAHHRLGCGLGFGGYGGLMAMIGRLKLERSDYTSSREGKIILEEDPATWVHPAFDFRLGVDYCRDFCWAFMNLELGYQLDYYVDATRHNIWIGGAIEDDAIQLDDYNAGFGGLYIRLTLFY